MNKLITGLALLGLVIMLAACGTAAETSEKTVPDTTAVQTEPEVSSQAQEAPEPEQGVDVVIAPNKLAFNQLADLLDHREESRGKIVQVMGQFASYYLENSGYLYIACEVPDPSTCCMPCVEFELPSAVYPDDYPEQGAIITVRGEFDTYERDGATFAILRNAVMK